MASETFADELRAAVASDKRTLYTELMLQAAELLDEKNASPAPAATNTRLETIGYAQRGTIGLLMEGAVDAAVIVPRPGGDFETPVVMREKADELLAEKDVIIRSHLTTITTLNANNAAFEELCGLTFAIQHNPNCPAKFLVRLPGKSGRIDMKPYADRLGFIPHQTGDILGFGKTLHEAARIALLRAKAQEN